MIVLRVAEVRALDRWAIEELGLPGVVLMENAGAAAARAALRLAAARAGEVWVLAGPGNNGGDGWVVARHARCAGRAARVLSTVPTSALHGDAAVMAGAALALGVPCEVVDARERWEALARRAPAACAVLVDGLLGTGASGAPRGAVADAVAAFEALRSEAHGDRPPVLALDVPTGLHGEESSPPAGGGVLVADLTVTFAALKPALVAPSLRAWTGPVEVASIGVPVSAR